MPLTVELSALVHHVELTRSGWRDRALELMAVSTFFSRGRPQELDEVVSSLNQQVPAPLGRSQIKEVLKKATSRGTLLDLGDDRYKLAEEAQAELELNLSQSRENAERVADLFDGLMSDLDDKHRPSWDSFYCNFLTPLVSELGLRTYEVLSQEVQDVDKAAAYRNYLNRFDEEIRGAVADRLSRFLDPNNRAVRRFVLRV